MNFFFLLMLFKTYLRLAMGDKLLSDLLVIAVEKETALKITFNEAIDMFGNTRPRRYTVN